MGEGPVDERRHLGAIDSVLGPGPAIGVAGEDAELGELVDAPLVDAAVVVTARIGCVGRPASSAGLDPPGAERRPLAAGHLLAGSEPPLALSTGGIPDRKAVGEGQD